VSEVGREREDPWLASLTGVIINWEDADLTARCAESLIRGGLSPDRIVIVDNGSGDDSAARLREALPACVCLRLDENVGYSEAANAGARALPGGSYLVLNNDAFLHGDESLTRMLAVLENESVGIAVPRLLNPDLTLQRSVRPILTPAVSFVQASGLSRFIPNRWQPRWSTHWDHGSSRAIDASDAPAVLVRGTAWQQLGGFNESIRFFGAESDLCWRAKKLGWTIWFCADAEFVHLGSATTAKQWSRPDRAESIGRSEGTVIREQLTGTRARLSIAFISLGLGGRYVFFKARGNAQAASALRAELRGYLTPQLDLSSRARS
jgi:GT2 family glycosyltransferase